jgi:hypothetical protein
VLQILLVVNKKQKKNFFMSLLLLLLVPLIGISFLTIEVNSGLSFLNNIKIKSVALFTLIFNLIISLIIFILFDFSSKQFQFIEEHYKISYFDIYLGIDGISIYFVLLTTIIMPIALLSNWDTIQSKNILSFVIIILLLETLLLAVFLVLDVLLFYIFFESILPPLFLLIGLFGSSNKVRASFYLFLYTLLGSLFMLLSIITMSSIIGTTDFDSLYKANFKYITQLFLFYGIFIAFAVKTPTIFFNIWLLKAHVESPLSGSIILAGIKTMLALYLANCWEYLIRLISRKLYKNYKIIFLVNMFFTLGNIIINKNLYKIFRDHMLEAIKKNINNKSTTDKGDLNNLGSYLAGLIEGDGSIYIPDNNKNACMIVIVFNSKDLPLALKIQDVLGIGNIYKRKGKNANTYVISNTKGLIKIINLINGKMRTPKIEQLYKLIDRINSINYNIVKLPLDSSTLESNAWLAGFIEADGCFYIRYSQNKHTKTKKIACMLELAQKIINLNNKDLIDIMNKISDFLLTKLKIRDKNNQYWIRTTNMKSNLKLIKYFDKYPLFSSKYMDYIYWTKVFKLIINKEHKNNLDKILKYKENMNSKRTFFKWDHLNKFYL